jgi:ComF family protein
MAGEPSTSAAHTPWRNSRLFRLWRFCGRAAIDLVCPPQCQLCEVDLADEAHEIPLCVTCRSRLASVRGPICPRCAGPVPAGRENHPDCPRCENTQFHFTSVAGLGVYQGELRQAVLKIKQPLHEPLALTLGLLLADEVQLRWADFRPDLAVPVPMYWARRWTRGQSAAELLAETLCRRLNVSPATDALICRRNVVRQSTLPPGERFRNVRNAFRASKAYALQGVKILLIDDTLTTGATASEAARMLRQAGAAEVRVAVAARGIGAD